jgi:hypothetical protein
VNEAAHVLLPSSQHVEASAEIEKETESESDRQG